MDVRYYFDEVNFADYRNLATSTWKYSLGTVIEKATLSLTPQNLRNLNVAIVGVPFDSAIENTESLQSPAQIRSELYQLSKYDSKILVADFGNLKPASSHKGNYQALRDITDYFGELGIVTLVIGGSQDLTIGICEAFKGNHYFALATVDAFYDVKTGKEPIDHHNYLSRIFSNQPEIFDFTLLSFQSHYPKAVLLAKAPGIGNHIRLGNLRNDISLAEPVFRNSDVVSFDINSVKFAEAPGANVPVPNGLRAEEACQLAKFAGASNRVKVFGLFGLQFKNDTNGITTKLAAQILWYFIEGCMYREAEDPGNQANNTMYQVEVSSLDKPFVFLQSHTTGRWWMLIETADNKKVYFACSAKEYEEASRNEIPALWMKYVQKIDVLAK